MERRFPSIPGLALAAAFVLLLAVAVWAYRSLGPGDDEARIAFALLAGLDFVFLGVVGWFFYHGAWQHARDARALLESRNRLARLAESGLVGMVRADLRGRFLEANDAFLKMLGYSRQELNEGKLRWDTLTPDEFREQDGRLVEQLRTTGVCPPVEKEYLHKDGHRVPVLIGVAVDPGSPDACDAFVLDLTEQKRAEQEVRQLNETLERRVWERTAQLESANKELESFSYSVSHDLRAPLRHVSGFADLLLRKAGPQLDETARRYVQVIVDSARNAGRLVDDLLAFSRMGRSEMRSAPVDTARLVREVQQEISAEVDGRPIEWRIGELPDVSGDPAMLRLVWRNLLDNAVKYSRGREPAIIEVSGEVKDGEAVFAVRDNGAGFDMKYADKLFGVFQRLHKPDEYEGTGIGLANVRRIVHRHGGRTRAEGEVGRGACFSFTLPAREVEGDGRTEAHPVGGG